MPSYLYSCRASTELHKEIMYRNNYLILTRLQYYMENYLMFLHFILKMQKSFFGAMIILKAESRTKSRAKASLDLQIVICHKRSIVVRIWR